MKKFLLTTIAKNRWMTLLSLCFGLLAFAPGAIASANAVAAPTQITFTILNTCGSGDTYSFFLNGTSIGSVGANPSGGCTCGPALQTFTVNNAAVLSGPWNSSGANALRVVKNGGSTLFAWVSAKLTFTTGTSRAYYDYKGGDATQTNLCSAEYSGSPFDQVLVTSAAFYRDADADGFGDPNNIVSDYSPSPGAPPAGYVAQGGDCDDSDPTIPSQSPCLAKPFNKTAPGLGFTQELVASLPDGNPTSGYGFDSHGNPYTYSFNGNLYKIDLATTNPAPGGVGTIHPLVNLGPIKYRTGSRNGQAIGTVYNFTQYPDGTVYANSDLGVVQVNLETATATSEPLPGSAWGIVVDPQLNAHGHHNIITAGGRVIDPVDHRDLGSCGISGDGIAIDATGNFIFAASGFQIYKRTSAPGTDLPVFQSIGNYGGSPDGMAFGVVGTDQVVVSNDGGGQTVTMWKFPNNDFTKAPTPTIIASEPTSGEYGDQANVGPDGYFYITYWSGTRFPDGSVTGNTSVVRFGPAGRFLPPTHSDNISLTPATGTKTVGASIVLTANLLTTDLSTNQTVPVANTSVTFKVVGGPDNGQTFTGTTDASGNVTFTLVNQNGPGDDVVHAQFVDGNNNTQTSNNAVITFVKPTCTTPVFASVPGNQTANTSTNSCDNTVTYSSSESLTGTPAPTVTYAFTGATTGSGNGNGNGSVFNKGITTVTLTATNSCGSATSTFTVTVTDNVNPTITAPAAVSVSTDGGQCSATNVSLGAASFGDNCSGATVSNDAPATFPKGNTTVTWTVTDASGNTATATQVVTVNDTENPTITAPAAVSVSTDAGKCSATGVSLGSASFGDNCPGATVSNNAPATFSKGNTTVTWTVTDASGNTATATQVVTVNDTENPTITAPAAVSVSTDAGKCSATGVSLGSASFGDNCPGATVSNNAPATFPKGNTTVTWTVTDASGNTATATQVVTVKDTEKPVAVTKAVTVILVNGTATITGASVDGGSSDNCGTITLSVSSSEFHCANIGANTVTLTVTDGAGNTSTQTAVVNVTGEIPVISITSAPTDNTYTGGVATNLYLGYGAQTTTLNVNAPASGAPYTYAWTGTNLSSKTIGAPVFTPTTAGTYSFSVLVTNKYGCTSAASITVCVKDIRVAGTNGSKVYICHQQGGSSPNTLSVSVNAIAGHLSQHPNDKLGVCGQGCTLAPSTTRTIGNEPKEDVAVTPKKGEMIAVTTSQSKVIASPTNGTPSISISPVPNRGIFNVQLMNYPEGSAEIRITDMNGRIIATQQVNIATKQNQFHFNLSDKAQGTYNVTVIGQKKIINAKVIITR